MPAIVRRFFLLAIACFFSFAGWSAQLTVHLVDKAPVIDGKVTAEEQNSASAVDLIRVGGLDKPKYPTRVYVSATLDGLYVGFVATEPHMNSLVTSATEENDAVFNDDSVQILITPTLETAADAYYHFAVNSNGVRYSNHLIVGEVVSDWKSAVSKGTDSWQAEFFIPLDSIKAPEELPYWRVNFARERPQRNNESEETSAWINPGISLHNYKRFGYMTMPRFVPDAPPSGAAEYTTAPVEVFTTATLSR